MRITKEADIRKTEILDKAEYLFDTKGYGKTTINDILKEVNIAKGTFYYHFATKEEVMNTIVDRRLDSRIAEMKKFAEDSTLSVSEKLFRVVMVQKTGGALSSQLHDIENAQLHQRSFVQGFYKLTPVLTEIVEEGIREKIFSTPFPRENVELLLSASLLFDEGLFQWPDEERKRKAKVFIHFIEEVLGAKKGSLVIGENLDDEQQL